MPSFVAGLIGLLAGLVALRGRGRLRRGALLVAAAGLVVMVAAAPRGLALDKVIARLVLPAGFLWLVLLGAAAGAFLRRRSLAAVGLVALATGYWLAGAPVVGTWLLSRVEGRFATLDPRAGPPLDAVAVLGGGTRAVGERPALDLAGDRVMLGARLYLGGRTRHLITTGSSIPGLGPPRDLTRETAALWGELGIPESAVIRLPQPRNTRQEIDVLSEFVRTSTTIRTLGLVTSAWHLPRALALCERAGLEVVPLPADVRSRPASGTALQDYIPDGGGFAMVHRAGWEILGRSVGR